MITDHLNISVIFFSLGRGKVERFECAELSVQGLRVWVAGDSAVEVEHRRQPGNEGLGILIWDSNVWGSGR